ncbi:hypothetical protein ACC739_37065, partial [Rhizobium ruizarguesonis]
GLECSDVNLVTIRKQDHVWVRKYIIMSWHQHTVLSAAMRMRGTSFWTVMIFLMEAAVFILIGLSLRDVVERGGGFTTVIATMGLPMLA